MQRACDTGCLTPSLAALAAQALTGFFDAAEHDNDCRAFLRAKLGGDGASKGFRARQKTTIMRKLARTKGKGKLGARDDEQERRPSAADEQHARLAEISSWVRDRGEIARGALDAWRRAQPPAQPSIRTGFVEEDVGDGFLASAYELHVRLAHLLARWELMKPYADAAALQRV